MRKAGARGGAVGVAGLDAVHIFTTDVFVRRDARYQPLVRRSERRTGMIRRGGRGKRSICDEDRGGRVVTFSALPRMFEVSKDGISKPKIVKVCVAEV